MGEGQSSEEGPQQTRQSLDDDMQKLLAFQVAESAKAQLKSWATWVIGALILIAGAFGFRAYKDFYQAVDAVDERIRVEVAHSVDTRLGEELDRRTRAIDDLQRQLQEKYVQTIVALERQSESSLRRIASESEDAIRQLGASRRRVESEEDKTIKFFVRARLSVDAAGKLVVVPSTPAIAWEDDSEYLLFGPLPGNFLGVSAARPRTTTYDAYLGGEYRGTFSYHFVPAFTNPEADVDADNVVSIEEAVGFAASALQNMLFEQVPAISGSHKSFAFFPLGSQKGNGKARAVLVGISKYRLSPLRGCVNDVLAFRSFLTEHGVAGDKNIKILIDKQATGSAILDAVKWLATGTTDEDVLIFFFAGHGTEILNKADGPRRIKVLCPVDLDNHGLLETRQIVQLLKEAPAKQKLIIIE